jgi:hypothetical protein
MAWTQGYRRPGNQHQVQVDTTTDDMKRKISILWRISLWTDVYDGLTRWTWLAGEVCEAGRGIRKDGKGEKLE